MCQSDTWLLFFVNFTKKYVDFPYLDEKVCKLSIMKIIIRKESEDDKAAMYCTLIGRLK